MGNWELPELSSAAVVANRFVIERKVQSGGMGTVYRARDLHTDEPVALKLLLRSNFGTEEQRFLREAYMLSEFRHPGIVRYVAHGVTADRRPYLAMAWLDGQTLSERLAQKPLGCADSLRCIRTAAVALAVAHQRGVIHRDRKDKPNIWLHNGDSAVHRRRTDYAFLPFAHSPYAIAPALRTEPRA